MNLLTYDYLNQKFGIDADILRRTEEAESKLACVFSDLDDIQTYNQYKVLHHFQEARINDQHFAWNTGYGYDDVGRAALEQLYADVFGAEAGLVRPTIVNGTHALASVYLGLLRPGDELIYCNGDPYDTMQTVIGLKGDAYGNLQEFGVTYKQVDLLPGNEIDLEGVKAAIGPKTKICALQRSRGYTFRNAMTIPQIEAWAAACKFVKSDVICMVDNCYGEFTDVKEPVQAGADIMAGSLIKNPGGGLALSGGYVVGRKDLVDKVATRVTSPGIGGECGLTFGQTRSMFQGLFIAPRVTMGAVKGAALCAQVFADLGYEVCPGPSDPRNDIVEAVKLGSPEAVCAFCEGVQAAAPIDSYVTPVPWDMPGYTDQIIMAAGAFVGGSSIELSADAPMREPYIVYFQGGITYEHAKFGVIKALQTLKDRRLVK
ncbi:MAG: methionine gamma-lyase family protein [Firmicutes bacterium]|nr:methionine gamma-lyase family protein [Bacillota bacterium]